MNICYRCQNKLEDITPDSLTDINFFNCSDCHCQYTKKANGNLHDRWMMPITIALYGVIFEKNPLDKIETTVAQLEKKKAPFIEALLVHIKSELDAPKQALVDIHNFSYPNEKKLREFLGGILQRLESKNVKTGGLL